MPIRPFLNGAAFEPEAIRNMSVAFESVCAELGLSDKDDPATRLVASKIIEFRAERRPGHCTAAVHDTQGVQARIANGGGRFPPPWSVEETIVRDAANIAKPPEILRGSPPLSEALRGCGGTLTMSAPCRLVLQLRTYRCIAVNRRFGPIADIADAYSITF